MSGHRLRRWPNIVPALADRLVFAGMSQDKIRPTQVNLFLLKLGGGTLYLSCFFYLFVDIHDVVFDIADPTRWTI